MEEPIGAQYAVHVALQTLKERCKNLQEMVTNLEEENLHLKGQVSQTEYNSVSMSDFDKLKAQVAELTENKLQLLNKVKMVTSENQELWSKLSRLSHVNHNLGTQLSKINDSLVQYTSKKKEHSPLIRSKTFTQDEPHTKVLQKNIEENGKICAELEEISLKIINSFAQEKNELDSLYSEIRDIQWGDNIITDSCGFYYDDYDNNIIDHLNSILLELRTTKETVVNQKVTLQQALNKLNNLQELRKRICDSKTSKNNEMVDKSTSTLSENQESPSKSLPNQILPETSIQDPPEATDMMICPICCKSFNSTVNFKVFQDHVEKHFSEETFELL